MRVVIQKMGATRDRALARAWAEVNKRIPYSPTNEVVSREVAKVAKVGWIAIIVIRP